MPDKRKAKKRTKQQKRDTDIARAGAKRLGDIMFGGVSKRISKRRAMLRDI